MSLHHLELDPVSLSIDLSVGHIAKLRIRDGDQTLLPLHKAPWVGSVETEFPADTAPNVRRLSGDFLCAPFGRNDVVPAPSHGWPANSRWDHLETAVDEDSLTAVFRLRETVMGASVEKHVTLKSGHPFVYQEHRFVGGQGAVSAAHHVMVHMADGGDLAFSRKQAAETPPDALESDPARGRSILAYPARSDDPTDFPLANGSAVDLTRYPVGERHEDFVTLIEEPGASLGWTVVSRRAERDRVIVLKQPAVLPVTMLWMSNGGRDYAPWSGRHTEVLGIEDARASPLGHAHSCVENDWNRNGIPTAFQLAEARTVTMRQVIGGCSVDPGEPGISDIAPGPGRLALKGAGGFSRSLSYDESFLSVPVL